MARIARTTLIALLALAALPATAARDPGRTQVPGADDWRRAAATGAPLDLTVAGRDLRVRVEPVGLLDDVPVRALDGDPVDTSEILVLRGTVEPSGWARLVVADDLVVGHLGVPGLGMMPVAPAVDGSIGAATAADVLDWIRARGIDTRIEEEDGPSPEGCSSLDWTPIFASPVMLLEAQPPRTFDVAWAVDGSFVEHFGDDWAAVAVSFINSIDQLFRDGFSIALSVVHLVAIADEDIPGTTTGALLDSLQVHYRSTYASLERDNVNLFTGREMTNAGGQVNCVGSAKRTTVSYSVGEAVPGGPYGFGPLVLLPDGAVKIAAHELAHTLSAHHHYANCVESVPGFDPLRTLDACTIMINDWGLIQPVFSSLTRLAVRGWADHYDL